MKGISILGSTGSIGTQTLDVIQRQSDKFKLCGIAAGTNIKLLEEQIRKFKPLKASVADKALFHTLKNNLADTFTEILAGEEGALEIASMNEADTVVSAIVGIAGLRPTLSAIDCGKTIALANKETMVTAGEIVTKRAKEKQVDILPVDSEHSAIFQCLMGNTINNVNRLILTASGGPFFGKNSDELKNVTLADTLKHPNWVMGKKITVDSATLMNKGFELIEAKWLFDVPYDKIDILVHRQSVIHSMVEFNDGAILAQLGEPDMRVPISVALNYPSRENIKGAPKFDFIKNNTLTFAQPDEDTFKCLKLAKKSVKIGKTMPAYLNGANEMVVKLFLEEKIKFWQLADILEKSMDIYVPKDLNTLEDVFKADADARNNVMDIFGGNTDC